MNFENKVKMFKELGIITKDSEVKDFTRIDWSVSLGEGYEGVTRYGKVYFIFSREDVDKVFREFYSKELKSAIKSSIYEFDGEYINTKSIIDLIDATKVSPKNILTYLYKNTDAWEYLGYYMVEEADITKIIQRLE